MNKNLLLIISLFLMRLETTAQTDNQDSVISSMQSRTEKIEKGRSLLLDAIIEENKTKALDIKNFLSHLEDSNYISLYPGERWFINYWTANYKDILIAVENFDSTYSAFTYTRVQPRENRIYQKLQEILWKDRDQVINSIKEATLSQLEKDFLILNFQHLLLRNDYFEYSKFGLNISSNDFLDKYDQSVYEDYIRKYIRVQYKPLQLGLAFELFSGYGIFTEELSSNFKNFVPIGAALDIYYNRFILYLRTSIGYSRTLDSLSFQSGTWEKNAAVRIYLSEASLGYVLLDWDFMKIAPFVGISSTHVSPTEYDRKKFPEYEDVGLNYTSTYTLGINLDFKLGSSAGIFFGGPEESYWFIRLRYSYNQPQFNKKYQGYDGNFHYLTVGIGGFGRKLKRDY